MTYMFWVVPWFCLLAGFFLKSCDMVFGPEKIKMQWFDTTLLPLLILHTIGTQNSLLLSAVV